MKKIFFLFLFFISLPLFCFDIAGGHRGKVTALIHNGDTVISAGEDGFIVIWSVSQRAAMEKFQLTTNSIKAMVKHPLKDEICVIESGDMGNNKISAWNYKTKEKIFSVHGSEGAAFINYSAGGKYIITAGFDGSHFTLLDSSNGKTLSFVDIPSGAVTFGITGRTEQNILLYQGENEDFEGQILYLDLKSLSVTGRFRAPSNLSNPIILGNNRFLAGINSGGLLVTDAATGLLLDSIPNIERSALLYPVNDGFFCLSRENNLLYRFTVDRHGTIITGQKLSILPDNEETISAFAINGTAVFANEGGDLFMAGLTANQQSRLFKMTHNFQERITEIAVNNTSIAFLTEDGGLGFLPQDFKSLKNNSKITLEKTLNITRITAITPFSAKGINQKDPRILSDTGILDTYILWQSANTQIPPRIVYSDLTADELSLNFIIERYPLRSISSRNGNILVLDSAGRLCVYNFNNFPVKAAFTFSSVGAIDAAFVDDNYFLLCRSAINGSSPFLFVNYNTGETVPVSFPAQAGIFTYTGNSGKIYAASVIRNTDSVKTVISTLSANRVVNETLFEYPGETVNLTIAESAGKTAIAAGGEGAKIYAEKVTGFDRTQGLPVKLLGGKNFFLSLDSEGNISWHDTNGKLLAVFRIYKDRWVLETGKEILGGVLE
jgi:WD40 repeat protein